MRAIVRLCGVLAATVALTLAGVLPAQAADDGGAVFVQTNDPTANAIDVFHRHADGSLTFANSYATGGNGGRAAGSASDPLASQGGLVLVREADLLLAVNAGSDTISVFKVDGDQLHRIQVLSSNGPFPTSLAVHGGLVYVLDAGGQGFVSGFRITESGLHPISNSTRSLGLANATPPFFLTAPAQIGFTPDGAHLIVTTKTINTVDVFSVSGGRPSATPTVNAAAGVPFAFLFDHAGRLVLNFAASGSLQTYRVNGDNTITPVSSATSDGQAAACWATAARGFIYVSNTGSGNVSQFRVASNGTVVLVNGIAASGISGAIDSATAGGFLYVQSGGSGTVDVFRIAAGGSLTPVQVMSVPGGASQEGIVAG
jgi:6-phosphogluconolactonase (cycloisomerase 2 family)